MVHTEQLRHEFSLRLTQALNKANYPAHGRGTKLAHELGVTSKAVSKWLSGESVPRPAMLNSLAKVLNADPLWLQHGELALQGEKRAFGRIFGTMFPLIAWEQIDGWKESVKNHPDQFTWHISSEEVTEGDGFWLKVKDETMTSSLGVSVPNGALILVETGREPDNGQLIIAKLPTAPEATFKQFILDKGVNQKFLRPLNINYPPIMLDDLYDVIGVVVESRMSLSSPLPPPFPHSF